MQSLLNILMEFWLLQILILQKILNSYTFPSKFSTLHALDFDLNIFRALPWESLLFKEKLVLVINSFF